MTYSYYPGCTLRTKAKDLDAFGRFALEKLGVTLQEVEDWQCCGGAYTMAKDEIASKLSSVRALNAFLAVFAAFSYPMYGFRAVTSIKEL